MQRLVYTPRAFVYIKDKTNTIYNISKYVTSGSVSRKIDQVSSAEIRVRNADKLFTVHENEKGEVVYPLFSPMDPITIYLRRVKDHPVRVFTGFLDTTPYLQLFPGEATLKASCTLKRIQHTYFDPALPYTQSFLTAYGWTPSPTGGWQSINAYGNPDAASDANGVGKNAKTVYSVGDSLALGTEKALKTQLKGVTIESSVAQGRTTIDGVNALEARAKAGDLPDAIVISLGTNEPTAAAFKVQVERVLDDIVSSKTHVIWANISRPTRAGWDSAKKLNDVLDAAKNKYANMSVMDWDTQVEAGKIKLSQGDHIHTNASGYSARAALIADLVTNGSNSSAAKTVQEQAAIDGSLSMLLMATMAHIGHWNPDDLYIERLPDDLFERIREMADEFSDDNAAAYKRFEDFLKKMIGSGSYGKENKTSSGADVTTGDDVKGLENIIPVMKRISESKGVPPEMTIAVALIETGLTNKDSPGNPHYGWFQMSVPSCRYKAGPYTVKDTHNLGWATTAFCEGAANDAKNNPSIKSNLLSWAMLTQGVNGSNNPLYPSSWNAQIAKAKGLLAKYGDAQSPTSTANGSNPDPDDTPSTDTSSTRQVTASSVKSPGNDGFAPVPGFPSEEAAVSVIPKIVATIRRFPGLSVTDAYDRDHSAGHKSPGHNVTGTACDFAGPDPLMDKAVKYLVEQGYLVGYDGRFGSEQWPGHGPTSVAGSNAHLHVEFATKGGKDLGNGGSDTVKSGGEEFGYPLEVTASMGDDPAGHVSGGRAKDLSDWANAGWDLLVPVGTKALSPCDGEITKTHEGASGLTAGWQISFTSKGGKKFFFNLHQGGTLAAKVGPIKRGDLIGTTGNTGVPHLHFGSEDQDLGKKIVALEAGDSVTSAADNAVVGSGTGSIDPVSAATAGAFFGQLQLPSIFESNAAIQLAGDKSLLNDVPLLPFIQQLCGATMRQFQSLPDGRFYAFYPDYFGEYNHHDPYWEIEDIEILDGKVNLSDDSLVTHMYVVGDTVSPGAGQDVNTRGVYSSGVVTIFNAFMSSSMLEREDARANTDSKVTTVQDKANATAKDKTIANGNEGRGSGSDDADGIAVDPGKDKGLRLLLDRNEAANFLNRYGARPVVEDMVEIRSPYYEMFLAYQKFMLGWSRQFLTPFEFTFMPELFPGGKIGFPEHNLQMYIESVDHTWSYTDGFTTQAQLSAPSVYAKGRGVHKLPPNMARAIIEPAAVATVKLADEATKRAKDTAKKTNDKQAALDDLNKVFEALYK